MLFEGLKGFCLFGSVNGNFKIFFMGFIVQHLV